MSKLQNNSVKEAWILCLILGMIMINFPFIHIFNNERLMFGIPILVLYFFIGWPASILVTWYFVLKIDNAEPDDNDPPEGRSGS